MATEQSTCSKVTTVENFRVQVVPQSTSRSSDDAERARYDRAYCDEMHDEIRRHVDNVGDVSTECDTRHECSKCGHDWEPEPGDADPSIMECSHCGRAVREEGSDG